MSEQMNIADAIIGMLAGVALAIAVSFVFRTDATSVRRATIIDACGPCDHEAECGAFECVVGKEGWQRKEGAK